MWNLHIEVSHQITLNNDNYKSVANLHNKLQEFAQGDKVILRVPPQRISPGTWEKLHTRRTSSYKVLKRIGSNAYELYKPWEPEINIVFSIKDLTPYRASINYSTIFPRQQQRAHNNFKIIHYHYNHKGDFRLMRLRTSCSQVISTVDDGYQRYLVRWK